MLDPVSVFVAVQLVLPLTLLLSLLDTVALSLAVTLPLSDAVNVLVTVAAGVVVPDSVTEWLGVPDSVLLPDTDTLLERVELIVCVPERLDEDDGMWAELCVFVDIAVSLNVARGDIVDDMVGECVRLTDGVLVPVADLVGVTLGTGTCDGSAVSFQNSCSGTELLGSA